MAWAGSTERSLSKSPNVSLIIHMMSELGDRTSHTHAGRGRAAAAPAQTLTGRAERAENAAMVVDTCQE